MNYKITFNSSDEESNEEFTIPYHFQEEVWVCIRQRNKYVVERARVRGAWATNIVGVIVGNCRHQEIYFDQDEFDRVCKNKQDAIDWCIKHNPRLKVKVYEV